MRSASQVINEAVSENRKPEWLLYGVAIGSVLTGQLLIVSSIYSNVPIWTLPGLAMNLLAWPAYREARALRAESLRLRLLEIPLSKAQTADEAAQMLDTFTRRLEDPVSARIPVTPASGASAT